MILDSLSREATLPNLDRLELNSKIELKNDNSGDKKNTDCVAVVKTRAKNLKENLSTNVNLDDEKTNGTGNYITYTLVDGKPLIAKPNDRDVKVKLNSNHYNGRGNTVNHDHSGLHTIARHFVANPPRINDNYQKNKNNNNSKKSKKKKHNKKSQQNNDNKLGIVSFKMIQ